MAETPTYQPQVPSPVYPEGDIAQPSANQPGDTSTIPAQNVPQYEFQAGHPAQYIQSSMQSFPQQVVQDQQNYPTQPQQFEGNYYQPVPQQVPGGVIYQTYPQQVAVTYSQPVPPQAGNFPTQTYYQPAAGGYMQGYPTYYTPQPQGFPQGTPAQPQPVYQQPAQPAQFSTPESTDNDFDFTYVPAPARIAVYDDFLTEPRIITISPGPTTDFIGSLASNIYQEAQKSGGSIAYSVILQVTENFIHARFSEMVVSIFNHGRTIRFSDKGPGFKNKDQALQPGFSSATQPMKSYIKGVGSGLPTVKEWLELTNGGGKLTIEDNLNGGSVVTLSLDEDPQVPHQLAEKPTAPFHMPSLTEKEKEYLQLMAKEGPLRITDFVEFTGISKGTVAAGLNKLEQLRLVENEEGTKRRTLTALGIEAVKHLTGEE